MTAAPERFSLLKLHCRGSLVCRTCDALGEAVVSKEEASKRTWRTLRGRGPSTYARIAEIMSGRTNSSPRRRLYEPEASRDS